MKKIFLCVVILFCPNVQGMFIKQLKNRIKYQQQQMRVVDKKCTKIRNQTKQRDKELITLDKKIEALHKQINSEERIALTKSQIYKLQQGWF